MSGYIANRTVPVTASDIADLPAGTAEGLLVGTAGAATIIDGSGEERVDVPLQQGYNPIRAKRVKATGLTAFNIWALY